MSNLLIDDVPLMVLPKLATAIGLNKAIVLQQVHYWLQRSDKEMGGRHWIYNTYRDWERQFPFWSNSGIRKIIGQLRGDRLLITTNQNGNKFDHTLWYSIDYEQLEKVCGDSVAADSLQCSNSTSATRSHIDMLQRSKSTIYTETTNTENTTENTRARRARSREPDPFSACEDEELRQALKDFEEMRRVSCKKPMTNRAKSLLLNRLKKLAGDDYDMMLALLNQSIEHGWQTVYPLKQEAPQRKSTGSHALDVGQQAIEMLKAMEQENDSGG